MPFGLCNTPQVFQRWMDSIFSNLDFCVVYIDDILVFSKTREEHTKHLEIMTDLFQKHGIILSPKKIEVEQTTIEFLGLTLNPNGIQLQDHILIKLKEFPDILVDKKQLQSFLGILNYGRQFIKDLSKKEKSLQRLLKKDQPFEWTPNDTVVIQSLKNEIQHLPPLYFSKTGDYMILETDASNEHWGAVLKCKPLKNPKAEELCGYNSGKFKPAEINYIIYEKELLAIINGLKRFKIYLASDKFLIRTDNQAVKDFLKSKKREENPRRINWFNFVSQFPFEIEYIKGSNNVLADFLSRESETVSANKSS